MAIPTETEIISSGNILGNVKGSVYIDNAISRVKLYTDKITTDYKIANIESVYKLATNGLLVKIDVSKCVVAVDKLSFTNVDLANGDLVWFVYKYIHDNDVFGKTDITFYKSMYKYAGKKVVFIGDSITEINLRATKRYHDYIVDDLKNWGNKYGLWWLWFYGKFSK